AFFRSRSSNLRSCLSIALGMTSRPSVTSDSFASPSAPTLASNGRRDERIPPRTVSIMACLERSEATARDER
ncbi:hypothetical protein PENTCL1PPCAC_12449, partial [Pristionchus entomophagus]